MRVDGLVDVEAARRDRGRPAARGCRGFEVTLADRPGLTGRGRDDDGGDR